MPTRNDTNRTNNRNHRDPKRAESKIPGQMSPGRSGDYSYNPIDLGEQIAQKCRSVSESQLRNILSLSAIVKNKIERNKPSDDMLSTDLQHEIQYIRLKLIYQMGRDRNLKRALNDGDINLPQILKNIGNSRSKFNDYYHLMEAIIAYKKFFGNDQERRTT